MHSAREYVRYAPIVFPSCKYWNITVSVADDRVYSWLEKVRGTIFNSQKSHSCSDERISSIWEIRRWKGNELCVFTVYVDTDCNELSSNMNIREFHHPYIKYFVAKNICDISFINHNRIFINVQNIFAL